jgi:hypothetical protein
MDIVKTPTAKSEEKPPRKKSGVIKYTVPPRLLPQVNKLAKQDK